MKTETAQFLPKGRIMSSDRSHFIISPSRITRRDNNIHVEKFDENGNVVTTKTLPVETTDEIYLIGKTFIDSYTMSFLADNNILIHFFSPYQSFRGNFFPTTSKSINKSGFALLQQVRAFDDPIKRLYIAKEITRAHFLNDAANCKKYNVKFDIDKHIEALDKAGSILEVMAVEGAFQKFYYEKWNEIIIDQRSFKFTVRSKRPPADKINSFISYINTRIYNVCLSEIYKTELDPRIGFLHEPNYRALSLHLDIAEIFKPILGDTLIFNMLNKKEITAKDFETDHSRIKFSNDAIQRIESKMIEKLCDTVNIGDRKLTWRQVIRRDVNRLKKCVCEDAPFEPFLQ